MGAGWRSGWRWATRLTALFLLPAAFLLGALRAPAGSARLRDLKLDLPALGRQLAGFLAGLAPYLLIPLRALSGPPVNWGNAVTPARLWWLVSGRLYQSYYLDFGLAGLGERVRAAAGLTLAQFGFIGLLLGLLGLVVYGSRSRLYALTAWSAAGSLAFALFYRPEDASAYLAPLALSFAIWIGLGLAGLERSLAGRLPSLGRAVGLLAIAWLAGRSAFQIGQVDASADLRAERFGEQVLAEAPQNALVFASGDRAVFALWYYHFALGRRPDLAVVAADLLHFDWYQETLRATYPGLDVPGPFPWPETIMLANPARPACTVAYLEQAEIECQQAATAP